MGDRLATAGRSSTVRAPDSAMLVGAEPASFNAIATAMNAQPSAELRVEGYTDDVGNADLNRTLSAHRADVVRRALIDRGVGAERVSAAGDGMERAVASNSTEEGRSQNRRVEVVLTRP
jgi:outer membrane protein OmpA-like peptidoglycan-associated protein